MTAAEDNWTSGQARTLPSAELPDRVRRILEATLHAASDELERMLVHTLTEFEQHLFRLAEHARNPGVESGYLQTLRNMRVSRADFIPRFMLGFESCLASMQVPADSGIDSQDADSGRRGLSLVEEHEVDANLMLRDIAQRAESRATLPLHLLCQRFGVLAASPAYDPARLPVGPLALCRILLQASQALQLPDDTREMLLRTFERTVMAEYAEFVELINATLATEGVLPALTYVPVRVRPAPVRDTEDANRGERQHKHPPAGGEPSPHTGWSMPIDAGPGFGDGDFASLQKLLATHRGKSAGIAGGSGLPARSAGRRATDGPAYPTAELLTALVLLQDQLRAGNATAHSISDLKQQVVSRARTEHGPDADLTQEDSDTFDLLDLFYERIERDVRQETLAAALLKRLQVPLLLTALSDRGFFVEPRHPARQLLNTVAESGARWLGESDVDPAMQAPLNRAVDHVVAHSHKDPSAYERSNQDLQQQLQLQARRSEAAERRYVEAARGKEKLQIAKHTAADTIARKIGDRKPHKFVRALIEQAWADVLTLRFLRHGPDSEQWREMSEATSRIVAACCGPQPVPDANLLKQVGAALSEVGYHAEEASAIANRLAGMQGAKEDAAARTRIASSLKARARLGEEGKPKKKLELGPLTPDEQAQYDRVRVLPFGTWIEFVTNQQGDVVRKRLSWYSTITGNALFVNMRGQRLGEQSLESLARLFARGQARVVTLERAGLVDRAWQATLAMLKGIAGQRGEPTPAWRAPA